MVHYSTPYGTERKFLMTGIIIRILKKGALSECSNWCSIILLSIPSKILAKVVMKHLSLAVDLKLREEQAGFKRGRGCAEHIFMLRNISNNQTSFYRNFACCVGDGDNSCLKSRLVSRQGCVMPTILFNLIVDCIMRYTMEDQKGIRWGPFFYLEDLDYADNIVPLSHTHSYPRVEPATQHLCKASRP